MKISHVIRGEDHITNTPRQILIYKALGAPVPLFAHLPSVLGPDRARLSKRHGATSVLEYQKQGFLPDGLINYIARLGWAHGDQEIFTRQELITLFDLDTVNKASAVFDQEKLQWVNAQHLKELPASDLARMLTPFLEAKKLPLPSMETLESYVDMFRERARTLDDMADQASFIFQDPDDFDPGAAKKFLRPVMADHFIRLIDLFKNSESFDKATIQTLFEKYLADHELKFGKNSSTSPCCFNG